MCSLPIFGSGSPTASHLRIKSLPISTIFPVNEKSSNITGALIGLTIKDWYRILVPKVEEVARENVDFIRIHIQNWQSKANEV